MKKKEGYLKIHHIAVIIRTKEILALEVTYGKIIYQLIEQVLKKIKITRASILTKGEQDNNEIFNICKRKGSYIQQRLERILSYRSKMMR
jgi:transposase